MHRLLKTAIERNRVETVEQLLAENPQWAKQADGSGHTPLFLAVETENRSPACVRALIEAGADVSARVSGEFSILHWIAGDWGNEFNDHETEEIIALLAQSGADLEATNHYGFTPLTAAIIECNLAAIRGLLAVGANPNAIVPVDGYTDFHQGQSLLSLTSFSPNSAEMIKALLEGGADLNLRDAHERTALEYWLELGKVFAEGEEKYQHLYDDKAAECLALLRETR